MSAFYTFILKNPCSLKMLNFLQLEYVIVGQYN